VAVVDREFDTGISDVTAWTYLQELGWRYHRPVGEWKRIEDPPATGTK
jgi:hypothetical protein